MPLFQLGQIVATPACIRWCSENSVSLHQLIRRHFTGDWGDLSAHDKKANERAIRDGSRIFSSYTFPNGKVWVITSGTDDEGKRESTTALLPSDY